MFCVISVMTALAQSSEIFGSAIFGSVIQMSYCKHNFYHLSMTIVNYRMVLTSAELTAVVSTLQNLLAYLFPILRVSALILFLNWHISNCYTPNSNSSILGYFFLCFFLGLSCTLHLRCDRKQGHPSQGICSKAIP